MFSIIFIFMIEIVVILTSIILPITNISTNTSYKINKLTKNSNKLNESIKIINTLNQNLDILMSEIQLEGDIEKYDVCHYNTNLFL